MFALNTCIQNYANVTIKERLVKAVFKLNMVCFAKAWIKVMSLFFILNNEIFLLRVVSTVN